MTRLAGRSVYLDANVFIYGVERVAPFGAWAEAFVRGVVAGDARAVTSEIALAECLVMPLRLEHDARVLAFTSLLRSAGGLVVHPVTRNVLVEAARLRSESRLKLPDAIHAATARLAGCDVLVTNDAGIAAVPGVEVVRLADVAHG